MVQVCAWRLDATGTRRLLHEFTDGELIEIGAGGARLAVMDLGVGLPSTIPGATGADVLAWAREADTAGFASLTLTASTGPRCLDDGAGRPDCRPDTGRAAIPGSLCQADRL